MLEQDTFCEKRGLASQRREEEIEGKGGVLFAQTWKEVEFRYATILGGYAQSAPAYSSV